MRLRAIRGFAVGMIVFAAAGCTPIFEALEVDPDTIAFGGPAETQTIEVFAVTDGETRTALELPSPDLILTSSNSAVATVSDEGVVTAVGSGAATIVVEASYGSDEVLVSVAKAALRPLPTALPSSPADGESGVSVARETILTFDTALDSATVTSETITATIEGEAVAVRLHIDDSVRRVTLFYESPLPGDSVVIVTVCGDDILTIRGEAYDVDGDGNAGGVVEIAFRTASLTPVPGTMACGRVFASELTNEAMNLPLANVTITVDGAESLIRTTTGGDGRFCLNDAPAGQVFVHINGRTALDSPANMYYPSVGKMWRLQAAVRNKVGILHLPAVSERALITVSETSDTSISFVDEQLDRVEDVDLRLALGGVSLTVPAGSLFADDGTRGGRVGIAPVAADRLPGALPPGLDFPLVITVQTDGPTNFDEPVAVCFPNLPDPTTGRVLEPGDQSALWSFNHDTGRFEVVGPMTASEGGATVCTDEGVGIPAPGWHSMSDGSEGSSSAPPGVPSFVLPPGPECPPRDPDIIQLSLATATCLSAVGNFGEFVSAIENIASQVQSLSSLRMQFTEAFESYGRGDTSAAEIQLIIGQVNAAKNIINQVASAASSAESPISKAIALLGCAEALLNAAEDPCMAVLESPIRCRTESRFVRDACTKRDNVLEAVQFSRQVLEALNEQIADIASTAICRAIDAAEAILLRDASRRGAKVQNRQDRHLAVDAELLAVLTDLDALLEPLVVLSEQESEALGSWLTELASITDSAADVFVRRQGLIPNAYIRLEYGRAVQQFQAEETGFYRAVLTANTLYKLSAYDPASDQCGSNIGRSAAIGDSTTFHTPALQACAAGDRDGDGLSDQAEDIIGTSSDTADTDGDGVDDLTEVRAGTDPGGGSLVRFGEVIEGDLATPGEVDVLLVAGRAGEVLFLDVLGIAVSRGFDLSFNWFAPDGREIAFSAARMGDVDRGDLRVELEEDGVYTLRIAPFAEGADGSYRIRIVRPIIERRELMLNVPFSDEIRIPADVDEWAIHGTAGTTVIFDSLELLLPGNTEAYVQMLSPSGERVLRRSGRFAGALRFGPFTLQETGTYTLSVGNGSSDETYAYTFELVEVTGDDTMQITLGATMSGTIPDARGIDAWTLEISEGGLLFLDMLTVEGPNEATLETELLDLDGVVVLSSLSSADAPDTGDRGPFELDAPGTYRLVFRASKAGTSYSFRVLAAIIDTQNVTLGARTDGEIAALGEIDAWVFEGVAGQQIFFDLLDVTSTNLFALVDIFVVTPGGITVRGLGTSVLDFELGMRDEADFGPVTLSENGTHTLQIRPLIGALTGQFQDGDVLFSYAFILSGG